MPRDTLTRDQIVRAAVELLDAEGVDGLSMRRLGARLGSAATAVYWHVKNKDDLVVLAADEVWAEITLPEPAASDWRDAAVELATGMYGMVLRHPWLIPAMSTHMIYGPGKARYDDHCLMVYEAGGFAGADADAAMRAVYTYVLGTALTETAEMTWRSRLRLGGGDEGERVREALEDAARVAMDFPRLRARVEAWQSAEEAVAVPGDGLEAGLAALLDGLEARLAARTG